ncbi:PSD1 and planctomycete cytochrome C domain-containing protein [Rubripirellula reticaptiva]|uniref:Planctomycete cytochrome C n=1 Tax=Rubripirellula reticaptiva TaxID=2528013 RepID=A0A5C6F7D2_9BACT|nr:PSD1 and planctomycete cytochrome C domain-containing protein [Rubripirellula reticaptiva]TWU57135.1 Planctomycete cytochrome C [Rubripirellula reticaptiva]
MKRRMSNQRLSALLFAVILACEVQAVDFTQDIEPIIQAHCIDCHGPDEQESLFRLDRLADMLSGGNSGEPAVVPGKPDESFLLKLIRHKETGKEMPPDESLSKGEIDLVEQWIADGATTPESYGPAKRKVDLSHWAFQPVKRSQASGIDKFVHDKLTDNDLTQSPAAERRVLIRRLYLVMLGIPPSPQQVETFVTDDSDDAWQTLVERVLASSHYGERWATYWLDLVRFGETHGYEMNRERPTAWQYRDWVIQSLNDDKPYNEFVRQQIAGDALGADVATGFLVAGPVDQVKGSDPKLRQAQRMNELDDMINTTGTAFLGLTTGCARCHNHKFDPISQRDYYSMQAVFAGVEHGDRSLPPSPETKQQIATLDAEIAELNDRLKKFMAEDESKLRPSVNAKQNEEVFEKRKARFIRFTIQKTTGGAGCIDELEVYAEGSNVALADCGAKATSSGDFVHPKHKLLHINDGRHGNDRSWIVDSAKGGWVQIELAAPAIIDRVVWGRDRDGHFADRLPIDYHIESAVEAGQWELLASSADRTAYSGSKPSEPEYQFAKFPDAEAVQGETWLKRLQTARDEKKELEGSTLVYAGTFSQPGPTHRLYRGERDAKREQVAPNAIEVFTSLNLSSDAPERDRRLALANWVASKDNPLTARVIVNRLWQFHFGTGIVDTPSDFGLNGTPPSDPELLDWMASELMAHDWSLKHIHRLILNSDTWRQSNRPNADAVRVDATSRLLWRFPPRRLEAEAIRDSILAVTGVLDLKNAGGLGFSPFEVEMENVRHYHAKKTFGPADWRRMIYMTKVRQEREQVFGAFDCPDASMVVPKRSRSTTPLQALNLLNSEFVMQQAELFARRLEKESDTRPEQIIRAWQLCFQRDPTDEELADSEAFIQQEGIQQFTRAMLNANEFVFIP